MRPEDDDAARVWDIIVHGYAQLDHNKLWNAIQNDVPKLLKRLSPLLDE